jgi:type IV pilus assembly protein PilN
MLTINLLPHKRHKPKTDGRKQILLGILLLLLLGTAMIQARQMLATKAEHLRQEKQDKVVLRKKLQKKLSKITKLQNQLQDLDRRISIIRGIRARQAMPVRYLDVISGHVPEDKIWFESLSMDNKGRITLSGVALDNQVFARYLRKLRGSKYIADVSLQQTQRKSIQNLDLVAFRCSLSAAAESPDSGETNG